MTRAASNRAAASSARPVTDTNGEAPGGIPSPLRRRSAIATSWAWTAAIPTSSSSASAGSAPTQFSHAGERSKRRASSASRSGAP